MRPRRPVPPTGYISLVVTPDTVRRGDLVWIDGHLVPITDMRAVNGRRDAVTLIFPGGHARLMGPADTLNALRAVEQPARPEQAR